MDRVRPNKLRKLVMKQMDDGATWTQFQECLDDLVARKVLKTGIDDKKQTVIIVDNRDGDKQQEKANTADENVSVLHIEMDIPIAVAHHLTRKGSRKQKNIEETTKVKIEGLEGVKKHASGTVKLEILKPLPTQDDGDDDDEEKAEKQIKAAARLIDNMIESYREHPERFETKRKAGGTLEEQALAKKIRKEGALRFRSKKQKHGFSQKKSQDDEEERETKKKQRTFY